LDSRVKSLIDSVNTSGNRVAAHKPDGLKAVEFGFAPTKKSADILQRRLYQTPNLRKAFATASASAAYGSAGAVPIGDGVGV